MPEGRGLKTPELYYMCMSHVSKPLYSISFMENNNTIPTVWFSPILDLLSYEVLRVRVCNLHHFRTFYCSLKGSKHDEKLNMSIHK